MSGFLAATLLFGVGAMIVVGPIEEALLGNNNILLVKSGLDFISSIILGSTLAMASSFNTYLHCWNNILFTSTIFKHFNWNVKWYLVSRICNYFHHRH